MRIYFFALFVAYLSGYLPLGWWQWWGLILCLVMVFLVLLQSTKYRSCLERHKCWLSLSLLAMAMASFWSAQEQRQIQLPQYLHKQAVLVSGCYKLVDTGPRSVSLRVQQARLLVASSNMTSSQARSDKQLDKTWYLYDQDIDASYMRLSVYDKDLVTAFKAQPQGRFVVRAVLSKPRNYQNPSGFDYVAWSQRQGQISRGYIKHSFAHWGSCPSLLPAWISDLRNDFLTQLSKLPDVSSSNMGQVLWAALVAGHSKGLQAADWQALHRTGTTHLMVISGLHIGLVAALVMWLGRRTAVLLKLTQAGELGIWLGWAAALTYAVFSGWGLPAQRAMIMLSALMLVNRFGLGWSIWQRLLLAWIITLLIQPNSIYSPGFWYSYVAVANLALVIELRSGNSWRQWLVRAFVSQLALLALLVPLIGATTGGLSLLGPLINLLLIPLFGLVLVPLLLLATLCLPMLGAEHVLILMVTEALNYLWLSLVWAADLPYAMVNVGHWPIEVWLLWGLLGSCALVLRYHWLAFILTSVCVVILILVPIVLAAKVPRHQITVFDIGQGLSIWLQSGNQHRLYDLADRYSSGFNLMEAVILPSLNRAGVKAIDRVYVGHWDRDHSGGLQALGRQHKHIAVSSWWLPNEARPHLEQNVPARAQLERCQTTKWQSFGQFEIRHMALWEQGMRGNNASCVLQVEWQGQRVLITGDIEKKAEHLLVQIYGDSLQSDILIAPHHGSRTSSSERFLYRVAPRSVIISAGYQNRFSHPHAQVIERYWRHGIQWYNTALHGQVRIKSNVDGVLVIEHTYN
jgi:competence protein ComEC